MSSTRDVFMVSRLPDIAIEEPADGQRGPAFSPRRGRPVTRCPRHGPVIPPTLASVSLTWPRRRAFARNILPGPSLTAGLPCEGLMADDGRAMSSPRSLTDSARYALVRGRRLAQSRPRSWIPTRVDDSAGTSGPSATLPIASSTSAASRITQGQFVTTQGDCPSGRYPGVIPGATSDTICPSATARSSPTSGRRDGPYAVGGAAFTLIDKRRRS